MRSFRPGEVGRRLHLLRLAQDDVAGAEILAAHDLQADILLDPRLVFGADVAVIDGVEMRRHRASGSRW